MSRSSLVTKLCPEDNLPRSYSSPFVTLFFKGMVVMPCTSGITLEFYSEQLVVYKILNNPLNYCGYLKDGLIKMLRL